MGINIVLIFFQENHIELFSNNVSENCEIVDSDDEPPPLPPPRLDSLKYNGKIQDRPLPNIPKSASDDDLNYISKGNFEEVSNRFLLKMHNFVMYYEKEVSFQLFLYISKVFLE